MSIRSVFRLFLYFLWVSCTLCTPGFAKEGSPKDQKVATILDYRKELDLSDAQLSKIRQALGSFRSELSAKVNSMEQSKTEFDQAVQAHRSMDDIKPVLERIYQYRFQIHFLDLQAARAVEDTLTSAQMERWREIQRNARTK